MAAAKPVVGFKIEEESTNAAGALHPTATKLSDGTANPYTTTVWGPTHAKSVSLVDRVTPNPYFTR